MTKRSRAELKSFFETNARPTESNFADFIDSALLQTEDGLARSGNDPLSITPPAESTTRRALLFYEDAGQDEAQWAFALNPHTEPGKPAGARPGFSVSSGDGYARLFIDRDTGYVGIGTIDPGSNLHVAGDVTVEGQLRVSGAAKLGEPLPLGDQHKKISAELNIPLGTGFYQAWDGDFPDKKGTKWAHLLVVRHSKSSANYQFQLASSHVANERVFFRKICKTNTTEKATGRWYEFATRDKLDVWQHDTARVRCMDFCIGHQKRLGELGRALVDAPGQVLAINWDADWQKGVHIFGDVQLGCGGNPVHFTSRYMKVPKGDRSSAQISNDTDQYNELMIVGNRSNDDENRHVGIWDDLHVHGSLAVAGKLTVQETDWTEADLNSLEWKNKDGFAPAAYYKDSLGVVHLRGVVECGDLSVFGISTIFQLPSDYCPPYRERRLAPLWSGEGEHARIYLNKDGTVVFERFGGGFSVDLGGISFRAR